jgi:phosphonate degradation associated HDIG domain protein
MSVVEEIERLFATQGDGVYFGEDVTQLEHALQSAALAEAENAPDSLVVASLLHDIGHLLHDEGEDIADKGVDTRHEDAGNDWLVRFFGPEVTEPVRLHVAAKRYLCAVNPKYLERLSEASIKSLHLQGGPYSAEEVAEFESNPHYKAALRLRAYDDQAKIVGLDVPSVSHYRSRIEAVQK